MEKIKINKIEVQTVCLFNPEGEPMGYVNELEMNDVRIQIKRAKAEGYHLYYEGHKIPILPDGRIEVWPDGFFDIMEQQLSELFEIEEVPEAAIVTRYYDPMTAAQAVGRIKGRSVAQILDHVQFPENEKVEEISYLHYDDGWMMYRDSNIIEFGPNDEDEVDMYEGDPPLIEGEYTRKFEGKELILLEMGGEFFVIQKSNGEYY